MRPTGAQFKSLTPEMLRELLDYNAATGVFTWRTRRKNRVQAGSEAGYIVSPCGRSYRAIRINGIQALAHRLAILYMTGSWPEADVDHKDGDSLNNAFENLRVVSVSENLKNKQLYRCNKTGVPGVSWQNSCKPWRVRIGASNVPKYLGSFSTLLDAAAARKSAEIRYGYYHNHGIDRLRDELDAQIAAAGGKRK